MHFKFLTKLSALTTARLSVCAGFCVCTASLCACSGINDSWEVKGGGFFKYTINGQNEISQELDRNDVEIPFIRNRHHYLLIKVPMERSARRDQISIMVNEPKLGKNAAVGSYTWIQVEGTPKAHLVGDSNYVSIDQKDDTKWTAFINLNFEDCREGVCKDSLPPINLNGRFHYWIAEDDR
jgi:hypothetical protein